MEEVAGRIKSLYQLRRFEPTPKSGTQRRGDHVIHQDWASRVVNYLTSRLVVGTATRGLQGIIPPRLRQCGFIPAFAYSSSEI